MTIELVFSTLSEAPSKDLVSAVSSTTWVCMRRGKSIVSALLTPPSNTKELPLRSFTINVLSNLTTSWSS